VVPCMTVLFPSVSVDRTFPNLLLCLCIDSCIDQGSLLHYSRTPKQNESHIILNVIHVITSILFKILHASYIICFYLTLLFPNEVTYHWESTLSPSPYLLPPSWFHAYLWNTQSSDLMFVSLALEVPGNGINAS